MLFLRVLDDLEGRIELAPDEYEVLGIAALLRKLLIDRPSLVHLVNREHRVKIRFEVSVPRRIWEIAGDSETRAHAANVAGAVHAGEPRSLEHRKLERLAKSIQIGGYDLGTRDLQPIGRVTVKGLRPLREAIETARSRA